MAALRVDKMVVKKADEMADKMVAKKAVESVGQMADMKVEMLAV